MRHSLILVVASWSMLGAFPGLLRADDAAWLANVRAERARKSAEVYQMMTRQTYSPQYGYSTGYAGRGNYYGNSAPFQGNFHFPPGYGYGSIYGNSGHPGFGRYTGPAWNHPAAWGY